MALFQYYNTGDDDRLDVYGSRWRAQTFTPSTSHKIVSVKLLIFKGLSAATGTLTVSIRATDGSGHPTGADLCSGTKAVNDLLNIVTGNWEEITFSTSYSLTASTKYALMLRHPDGTSSNYVGWRCDGSSPSYTGGCSELSTESGDADSWSSNTDYDYMFEEWGGVTGEGAGVISVVEERLHYVDAYGAERHIQGTAV